MTLLRGEFGSTLGDATVCAGCDQPMEMRAAVIVYLQTGAQLLHTDCWRPGRPGSPGPSLPRA